MDNLLESNERTLVMFDSVCLGLAECLALVHSDIKQMTEHRNQLLQLEQDEQEARASLTTSEQMIDQHHTVSATNRRLEQTNLDHNSVNQNDDQHHHHQHKSDESESTGGVEGQCDCRSHATSHATTNHRDPQHHHLAQLKLLDKRLADSFSQALSMCDQQKWSLASSKKVHSSSHKPSIFQVLLGKGHSKRHSMIVSDVGNKSSCCSCAKELQSSHSTNHHHHQTSNRCVIDDINKQTRLAMQYAKQLEAHVFRVEDLRVKYEMHLKMSLVVKSVSRAYLSTPNSSSRFHYHQSPKNSLGRRSYNNQSHQYTSSFMVNDSSSMGTNPSASSLNLSSGNSDFLPQYTSGGGGLLHKSASQSSLKRTSKSKNSYQNFLGLHSSQAAQSKTTIKEFIDNIVRLESEFESYMGSFLLNIEDIQGFARVCQGDVFEINIKYDDTQKFKTKISVLKDNRQKCDNRQTVFKARIADVIAIKAYECKGLGKRVLLGHKLCETRDLFTARSQLMTISLNQTGSIKLNLVVTWNPLHMAPANSIAPASFGATPPLTSDISHISLPPTPVSSSTMSSLSSARSSSYKQQIRQHHHQQHSHQLPENHHGQHQQQQHHLQYADPTYGYYIPEPDYTIPTVDAIAKTAMPTTITSTNHLKY